MKYSPRAVTLPILVALAFAGSNAVAEVPGAKKITAEQIRSGLPAEVAKDGQQFMNEEKATELRHRVNEQSPDQAKKERKQLQTQQNKKAQNQFQHREKTSGPHTNQSGSFGAFGGRSSSGPSGGSASGGGGGRGR